MTYIFHPIIHHHHQHQKVDGPAVPFVLIDDL